jgi:hypothetical protein
VAGDRRFNTITVMAWAKAWCGTRCAVVLLAAAGSSASGAGPATRPVSFARDVAPTLVRQCATCHGPEKSKGDYRVDTFERLVAPGAGKKAPVVAAQPLKSELLRRLTTADEDDRMPQKADPLPAAQVAAIARWIEQGAVFDGSDRRAPLASQVAPEAQPAAPVAYRRPIPITALAFSPDGKVLAAGGYHEVTLWDPADGRLIGRIGGLPQRVFSLDFSPDGRTLVAAGGTPGVSGQVQVCDVEKRASPPPLERIGDVMPVARFSPDGGRIAAGGADNAVRIYDAAKGTRTQLIEQHADWVVDVAFSPDGVWLATGSRDKSARVFDVRSGAMRSAMLAHAQPVVAVAFDAKGANVLSAARGDSKIRFWTAGEAKEVAFVSVKDIDVARMVLFPGSAVTAGGDGVVRQYSVDTKALERALPGGGQAVYALAYSAKLKRIAAGDHAGTVRIYDAGGGAERVKFVAAPGYRAAQ